MRLVVFSPPNFTSDLADSLSVSDIIAKAVAMSLSDAVSISDILTYWIYPIIVVSSYIESSEYAITNIALESSIMVAKIEESEYIIDSVEIS